MIWSALLFPLALQAAQTPAAPELPHMLQDDGSTHGFGWLMLRGADFSGFVPNWEGDGPRCGLIGSEADWRRAVSPAAGMGPQRRPFAPPATLWRDHVLVYIARIANHREGQPEPELAIQQVERRPAGYTVRTRFTQPAAGTDSYQTKTSVFVVLPRPVAGNVTISDEDGTTCTARPGG